MGISLYTKLGVVLCVIFAVALAVYFIVTGSSDHKAPRKPKNILFIIADDLGKTNIKDGLKKLYNYARYLNSFLFVLKLTKLLCIPCTLLAF